MWPGKEEVCLVLDESDKELAGALIRVLLLGLFVWLSAVGCHFLF